MTKPLSEQERYQQIDMPFYRQQLAPRLPEKVLDFHTHVWLREHFRQIPWNSDARGGKYMASEEQYDIEQLMADGRRMFPDRTYQAVCFGYPTPLAHIQAGNAYAKTALRFSSLFPLLIAGRNTIPADEIKRALVEDGFLGYKVYVNWQGNDYGKVTIPDMIGPAEMELANERRLIVLLHVPRSKRLADPVVREGVTALARDYPDAQIVLAHCGRCYLPDEMKQAIGAIRDLPNVYVDTSMVMDPLCFQMVFDAIPSSRVLYATDFPVAAMRGRRVYVMDHWVDVVLAGYPPSEYRVCSNDIRATFMAWEIAMAIIRAADKVGLSQDLCRDIFYRNGMTVIERVLSGREKKK